MFFIQNGIIKNKATMIRRDNFTLNMLPNYFSS